MFPALSVTEYFTRYVPSLLISTFPSIVIFSLTSPSILSVALAVSFAYFPPSGIVFTSSPFNIKFGASVSVITFCCATSCA